MKTKFLLLLVLFAFPTFLFGQEKEKYWIKMDSLYKYVQPSVSMQMWSVYTMGEKTQLAANGPLEPVQDRLSFMARRARVGFKGKPYKRLSYNLTIQYDNLGKDKLAGVRGSTNTGQLGILDAYLGWKITNNEWANLTFGYFHPQISRECITGDMLVNSFDKSPSQGYIRQHIVGKSYGRSTGLNVGGIKKLSRLSFGYNVGIFNNVTTAADQKKYPESTGILWSPVLAGRATFSLGDADAKAYALNYGMNNYFNQRKGITIGLNYSQQGHTDIFTSNQARGVDLLFNYGHLNFDTEVFFLKRNVAGQSSEMRTGHARLGYNLIVSDRFFLEPTFAYSYLKGTDPKGTEFTQSTQFTGSDHYYDAGINWYLNKQNFRISLHYIAQHGDGNNAYTDGQTFAKGNYLGLGFISIF